MTEFMRRVAAGMAGAVAIVSLVTLILGSVCAADGTCTPLPHSVQLTMLAFSVLSGAAYVLLLFR